MKKAYLIGNPLKQSPSPLLINGLTKRNNLDLVYSSLEIGLNDLQDQINSFRNDPEFCFSNVTVPYKIEVLKYLDDLSEEAALIESSSCIIKREGKLIGYNTDLSGFTKAILNANLDLKKSKVDVLGAGGATRAIVYSLSKLGAEVRILNRTKLKAKELADKFNCSFGSLDQIGSTRRDILINTTNVGMFPNVNDSLAFQDRLKFYEFVGDIVYNPRKTKLLKEAEKAGCKTLNNLGLEMLTNLLCDSFALGTGVCVSSKNRSLMFLETEQYLQPQ